MEGIIDAPADPAFDMIDICANNEDDEDEIIDETLTAKVKSFGVFFCHFCLLFGSFFTFELMFVLT